jgi:hypothetical protein
MARTKSQDSSFPQQPFNKLIDEDPQIVRVPLDNVDWGSRPSIMKKIENRNGMSIKHIPNSGRK